MGSGKRLALAAALLALAAIGFVLVVWLQARGSFARATAEWSEGSSLPVLVRPLGPPSSLMQAIPAQMNYSAAIVFDGDLWLAGQGGLERRNAVNGDLRAQWRTGAELPPAPITGLAVARLGAASEARLLATTAGEGLLSVAATGDIVQVLPEDAVLADLTAVLPISTGGVLLGTERAGLLAWNGETLRRAHALLADQQVTALTGDEGDLWIGTLNEGVLHWAGGSLSRFGEVDGLADRRILSLVDGPEGIYAGTPLGVSVFRDDALERTLAEGFFAAALRISSDVLLIGTSDEGVVEVPLNQQRRPLAPGPRTAAEGPQDVRAFVSAGSSVLAVTSSAVYARTEEDLAWRALMTASSTGLRDRNTAALYVDPSSRLWVGYFDRGLDVLNSTLERVAEVENDQIFCVNRIKAARDAGTTAVATANGLAYFDANAKMRQFLTEADGLIASHVTDVAFSGDATVLATPAGLTYLGATGAQSLYAFHGLVNNHVYSLSAASDRVLAGTLGGLSILDGGRVTGSFTTANSALTHNWVSAIASFGGDWYVGFYGGGVMRLTAKGEWVAYPELRGVEINPNAMISSSTGVYAGTLDRGLLAFEPSTETWRFVNEGLPSKNVTALALGHDVLYIGTDNGMVRTNELGVDPQIMRTAACILLLAALILPSVARPDAGVLVSGDDAQPDPRKLSLDRMKVDVLIDNGMARVRIQQVFASHVASVQEGQWSFALPNGAAVSDFAVWDDVVRIPGVILERRRAEDIYARLKSQAIDPGLLRQGEYGAEEARRGTTFSAKVVPIPGYGFKRIEIEYHERLSVEDLVSRFALPLRPDAYQEQTAGRFDLRLEVVSEHPLTEFRTVGNHYPLEITEQSENRIVAEFHADDLAFSEDLSVEYGIEGRRDRLEVLTFRDPVPPPPHVTANRLGAPGDVPGYFLASALLSLRTATGQNAGNDAPARTVIALFDSSLSMQWGKLDRSFRTLETLLQQLRPQDQFNVILFNEDAQSFSPAPLAANAANAQRALEFVRAGRIRGGTNLPAAWREAARQLAASAGEPYLFQLTDGGSTLEAARNDRLLGLYQGTLDTLPQDRRPRTFTLAVGDDANLPLLRLVTSNGGVFEHIRSTEPLDFKLAAFLRKIGRRAIDDLELSVESNAQLDLIYPLTAHSYRGSIAAWVGRYLAPAARALFRVSGSGVSLEARRDLPANDQQHPHVAREWAKARVDALLEKIERDGEDRESIEEIIRWSKQFKFVTPYTSFLAAPRSLLRPRVIRPGDPILRVQTDPSITSVTALFPFGLVKQLRYLDDEDAWQTRFLAPKDTPDGRHEVRLLLRDDQGRVFRETKSFLIASKPPTVRAKMDKLRYRPGERIDLKVSASSTTRTLVARLYGAAPAELRWNPTAGYNTGTLTVPHDLPAGNYKLQLTAEDFAHNIGVEEVTIAVAP